MRVKCPACLHNLDFPDTNGEGPFTCPDCSARFDKAGQRLDQPARPVPIVAPLRSSGSSALSPYSLDPAEHDEVVQERRDKRQERREERDFRRTERDLDREELLEEREERKESKDRNGL